MDHSRQIPSFSGIKKILEKEALKAEMQKQIDKSVKLLENENKKLKRQLEKLSTANQNSSALKENDQEKFSNVRMQLQLLHYLNALKPFENKGTAVQKGAFFSALLNRHHQRTRKQFSAINELVYSNNKGTAKNIRKDLIRVQELFDQMGLHKEAKRVKLDIAAIDKKHFPKEL